MKLIDILAFNRGHQLPGDYAFRSVLLSALRAYSPYTLKENIIVDIGDKITTLFSCHIDTVSHSYGVNNTFSVENNIYYAETDVLGADDGAGIYILLRMIEHGVNGRYVFHVGEEVGGIGSSAIVTYHKPFLKNIKLAVAFDRRGRDSIVTHQRGFRTCSYACASSIARALNAYGLSMRPDSTGVFTDTANYAYDICECTNLSVGYEHCHTLQESLDANFLYALTKACIAIDWSKIPIDRKPDISKEYDFSDYAYSHEFNYAKGNRLNGTGQNPKRFKTPKFRDFWY